jgi:hypothetical protein
VRFEIESDQVMALYSQGGRDSDVKASTSPHGTALRVDRSDRATDLSSVSNEHVVQMFIEELWAGRAVDELERMADL